MGLEAKKSTILWSGDCTLLLLVATGIVAVSGFFETMVGSKQANAAEPILETPVEVKVSDPNVAIATESADNIESSDSMLQVTSVSQLSDVKPTDWAFEALQSLVERYGCIAGYTDKTYRGNLSISRYEFAAGLKTCLDKIQELIAGGIANVVKKEDLETVKRLQEGFATELAAIRGRVDALEVRTGTLEKRQFSATTKLQGFSLFLLADAIGDFANNTPAKDTQDISQGILAHFTRLSFISSFTGKDALTTSFTSTNVPLLSQTTGTNLTNFVTDPSPLGSNGFFLDRLNYRFPVGDRLMVWLGFRTLQPFEFIPTVNPIITSLDGPSGRFSWFNPAVYRPGFDGIGPGLAYKFSKQLQLHAAYLAAGGPGNNPAIGYFNGNNTLVSQLTFSPTPQFTVALTYAHKYFRPGTTALPVNLFGATGSANALQPFQQNATSSENFGLEFNWLINSGLNFGGWVGYTNAYQLGNGNSNATIVNGSLNLTFPDLFQKGNRGGFIVGIPPKVTSSNYLVGGVRREDPDTSLHLEVFYTHRLNNNVSITPNFYVITQPEHNGNNAPIWVGVLRTNFTF